MNDQDLTTKIKLPWWTWVAPLLLIEVGDQLSLIFKYSDVYSAFYLPTAVALVLIHWWGPARTLPIVFIIGTLNSWSYATKNIFLWPFFGIAETTSVFLSWYLFTYKFKGKPWLPDIRQTILFLSTGLIIPILFEITFWQFAYIMDGQFPLSLFWERFNRDLLSELIANFSFALPILYFITPKIIKWGLFNKPVNDVEEKPIAVKKNIAEISSILILLFAITFILPFEKFWFVYGLFSLYFAIRFGFGTALLGNAYLFLISYLIPVVVQNVWPNTYQQLNNTNTFLGSMLLFIFSTLTGRVISDLKVIEEKLYKQNVELKDTNQELDRFVYSVSHDLSAPLKSILGLVNISRLTSNVTDQQNYLSKIESSVGKLESFIKEVLDYSQSKRMELVIESVSVKELCIDILDNLKYSDSSTIEIDMQELSDGRILNDRMRLKIILNNILTNAFKYQKKLPEHKPWIKISSTANPDGITIRIEDNGEGMLPDVKKNIFNMFYRGHHTSQGSGLGLYIAKEAVEKIHGQISVISEYGVGSTFYIVLPNLNQQ